MGENLKNYTTTINNSFVEKISEPVRTKYLPLKRLFDIVFGTLLFIPSSVVILVFMILVRWETPGKCFYSQKRVGLMGKPIVVTKLRSMYSNAESKSGAIWAKKNDDRITKVGHFMRKTRIDELPQLLSVIKGDMSLIGPRPERPQFTEEFSHEYPGFEQRLRIKPGLSGYAQVHGGYDIDPGKKSQLDQHYIDNIGLKMDCQIFIDTIKIVVTGDGAR
ncbi:sugar transferase [Pediococcus parvulus]|uniref:sugar transferase n=1 Tax=Pediococcus parvulus TaxID=54062 RepID=UPI00070AF917|nr:sugar transferase [Pediococcus parvulus]MCT3026923.1 sugar transferase [Pediococcus parvulus]GEL88993.1 capsular polysaccharide biosynthesis protein [Pediococcus parvulus]GHC03378.1 capsular polysaccharide biosynthesis protein [Pediococcus parvulus]